MRLRMLVLVLLLLPAIMVASQSPAAKPVKGPAKGFRAEFLADLDDVQVKLLDLATAVPAGKYGWRPGPGVRSVSEVYTHVAGSNYVLVSFLGIAPPPEMPKDIETITDKQKVILELQKSFDFLRTIVKNTSDADFEKPVTMFGRPTTERGVFVMILNHLHEHLGQSVAYARMNGVVPPWSR